MIDAAHRVASAHEAARLRNLPVTRADEVPTAYELITPEWLTAVLCANVPGARILARRLDEPDSGSTNRRRIFLEPNAEAAAAGVPRSVFCKATFELNNKILLSQTGAIHSEVGFYRNLRGLLAIEAPVALHAAYDPESYSSIVMLPDLLGIARFCDHQTLVTRQMAEEQVALLAALHGRFSDPALTPQLANVQTWPERFAGWEAAGTERAAAGGLQRAAARIPRRLMRRSGEIWAATRAAAWRHRDLPATLTHGDVHIRNWYQAADGRMGLGDWQAVSRAHWSRDLSYVLASGLRIEDRRAWEQDLIRFYLEALAAHGGPRASFPEAWQLYRQQMFHALASWTIPLAPTETMPDMQPEHVCLELVERAAQAVDDLDSLDSFGGI